MTNESAVTTVEADMLAASLGGATVENVPAPIKSVEQAEPAPPKQAPAKPAAPIPPPRHVEEAKPDAPDSGTQRNMFQYVLYAVMALLVIGQIASFTKISANSHKLAELEKALGEAKKEFKLQEAEQEKTFTEALQEKEKNVIENRRMSVAAETLNRLRDGAPEKKVIRRQGGDWFIMGKKEEPIGNAEVIDVLNNAYTRAKSVERPVEHMPPHTGNAICVLKPDGRGGTQVSIAYDYIVGEAKSPKH